MRAAESLLRLFAFKVQQPRYPLVIPSPTISWKVGILTSDGRASLDLIIKGWAHQSVLPPASSRPPHTELPFLQQVRVFGHFLPSLGNDYMLC